MLDHQSKGVFNHCYLVEEIRTHLQKMGMPSGDLYSLPDSNLSFKDGGQYKIEIPTVNSIEACEAIFTESARLGVKVNRITETLGIFRYPKEEIAAFVRICEANNTELVMSTGPRATYDLSATAQTVHGSRIGYRLRGQEQIVRALVDIKRASNLGVCNFLIYDEGLLVVLNDMRKEAMLPPNVRFKISAHCGHCNPVSIKLLADLGADSVNPVRDLQLPMLSAIRAAVNIPLDIHADNPGSSGGFIRTYEVPEIVRISSPVYLKVGNSALQSHGEETSSIDAKRMLKQALIITEVLGELSPGLKQSFHL